MRKIRTSFGPIEFDTYYITDSVEAKKVARKLEESDFRSGGLDIECAKLPKYKDHPKAGLCPYLSEIRLVQIYDGKSVYVFDIFKIPLKLLKNLLYSRNWIAHYGIYEIGMFTFNGLPDLDIGCSRIMSQLIWNAEHSPYDPEPEEAAMLEEEPDGLAKYSYKGHSLQDCTGRELGIRMEKALQTSDWSAPELSTEQIVYASTDSVMAYKLGKLYMKKIVDYKMERHYRLEKAMQHVVTSMTLNGLAVDWKLHEKFISRWDDAQSDAHRKCYGYFGDTNLNSGKQLETWANKYFKREPEILKRWDRTPKGKLSFNSISLDKFKGIEPIKHLLAYKEYSKLLNTYGESFAAKKHPITNRIHCEYSLSETRTGRLSSRNPNLQNWMRGESRSVFTPGEGYQLAVADFSLIEVRIAAAVSRDPVMGGVFKQKRDIYCEFGSKLYGKKITKETFPEERQFSKVALLSLQFGMGAKTLATRASIELGRIVSEDEARRTWESYRRTFKGYIEWCDLIRHRAKELGFARTVLGKMRHLNSDEVFTKAPSTYIQGSAGEVMKVALVRMRKAGVKLVNTVHDEADAVCKIPDKEETRYKIDTAMNGAFEYLFPKASCLEVAEATFGDNWYSAKG